jgi:hypothetical protein
LHTCVRVGTGCSGACRHIRCDRVGHGVTVRR